MNQLPAALALLAALTLWTPTVAAQQRALDLDQDRRLRDAVADARRLGLITEVSERQPGTLQLTIGPAFTTATSTSYNLSRLYLAYAGYQRAHEGPTVLELLHDGEKIGEYTKSGLQLTRQPSAPVAAPMATPKAPRQRSAWYAALGGGSGAADFTCERCVFERSPAVSGYVMLGRRVGQATVLGVEATGWTKSDEVSRGTLYSVTAVILGQFEDNLPLFLSAGLGYTGYRRRLPSGDVAADAVGYSARLGLELRLAGRLQVAPYVGLAGSFGRPDFTYADGTPYGLAANFSNLQVGAALIVD